MRLIQMLTVSALLPTGSWGKAQNLTPLRSKPTPMERGVQCTLTVTNCKKSPLKPFMVNITITNGRDQAILLKRDLSHGAELLVFVYDSKGQLAAENMNRYRSTMPPPLDIEDFVHLSPGYVYGRSRSTRDIGLKFTKPGTYYLQAVLSVPEYEVRSNIPVWTGTVRSDLVRIVVGR